MVQKTLDGKDLVIKAMGHSQFTGLDRVCNIQKRNEIQEKLSNPTPSHYERVWLVNYLLGIGWNGSDIYNLIAKENEWDNYDDNMTYNQIMGIERRHWRQK
jgi:hypothetical protein